MGLVAWIRDALGMEEENGTAEAKTELRKVVKETKERGAALRDVASKSVLLMRGDLEGLDGVGKEVDPQCEM